MITRLRRGLHKAWAFTQTARLVSASRLETAAFFLAVRTRALHEWPFRFKLGAHPFWVRPIDVTAMEEVLLEGEYTFAARVLANLPAPAPVVVDAGANIGMFSLAMRQARPDAQVHALEPSAKTFALLRRNAAGHGDLWRVYRLALWREDGQVTFSNREASTASRITQLDPAGQEEAVPCLTLSAFLARHVTGRVTLLKLDIEGAEEAVLAHAEQALAQVDHLVIEIHPNLVDEARVRRLIEAHFPFVTQIPGRRSTKPLLFASRTRLELPA